jgi:hypothetical protein
MKLMLQVIDKGINISSSLDNMYVKYFACLATQSNLNFKIADRAPITFYIQLNWPEPFIFKSNNTFSLSFDCYTRIDCELFRLETLAHTAGARIITISLLHNAECNFPTIFERRAPLYILHG